MNETSVPSEPAETPSPDGAPTAGARVGEPSASAVAVMDQRAAKHERRLRDAAETLPTRVPWLAIGVFVAIAFGLFWAICLPFWLNGQSMEALGTETFGWLVGAGMFTPTIAAIVVLVFVQRVKHPFRLLGLRFRPAGRTLLFIAIAWIAPGVLLFFGALLAGAFGFAQVDFTGAAAIHASVEYLQTVGADAGTLAQIQAMPPALFAAIGLAQVGTVGVVLATLTAIGEEIGWRGWLLPNLRPLGTWPAILISSVIWSLWHAPIILLGYNFGDRGPLGLLLMTGFCVATGILLSWVRLRSGSVYPAAIGHGAINAFAGTVMTTFLVDTASIDKTHALIGWTTWVPFLVFGLLLALFGMFRKQPLPGLTLAESAIALEHRAATPAH